ncbi:MAG: VanW family protein [Gaiellaceae bacterium]
MAAPVSSPRARSRRVWRRAAYAVVAIAAAAGLAGLAFSGSAHTLPAGVRVAGIDVGGMNVVEARRRLEARAQVLAQTPVTFHAGGRTWRLTASRLGVTVDWTAAVRTALQDGQGPMPVRGFRRIGVRLFGADVTPQVQATGAALDGELARLADAIDRPHTDAALRLSGLTPVVVPAQPGFALDRDAAARVIVQSLASLTRPLDVTLPVKAEAPSVTAADLVTAAAQVRTALSAPVRLAIGPTRLRLRRDEIAQLLDLPSGGSTQVGIGGKNAEAFFLRLGKELGSKPRNARFEVVVGGGIHLVPGQVGRAVNVPASVEAVLRAALSPYNRLARITVETSPPKLTTADARAMGIDGVVATYTTEYGGVPNRIHNVQLVAHLIDNHLIKPGEEFSFNKTTGARDAATGFLAAPVIINGELQTGIGGGVCQVSTTTFNAAYEAGLKITARTNHALYISHYPLGRDATVNYPDTDLRFVNDTGHWLLLRTFVGASSLTVTLYGTNPHRKVESVVQPLVTTGPIPVKRTKDKTLRAGEQVVDDPGQPPSTTSVERKVYDANGTLLYDDTWVSHYVASPKLVRFGPKTKKPVAKPAATA